MKVILIKDGKLYNYVLPKEIKDNYWITDIDSFDNIRNLINIEADNGNWTLVSNYDTHIVDTKNNYDRIFLVEYQFYTLKNDNEKNYYYLYAIPDIEKSYNRYSITENGTLLIGADNSNNIIYNNVLVSDMHAYLEYNNGIWTIKDNNSSTGIYVNDTRIQGSKKLYYGDIVFIAGLKIVIMNNFILINDINGKVRVKSSILKEKIQEKYEIDETVLKYEELNRSLYSKEEYFYRSPRFIEDIYKEEIVIDNPPAKIKPPENSIILTIGPMFTMALTSFTTTFMTISNIQNGVTTLKQSIPSLVTAGSLFVSMLVWPIIARIIEKKRRKKQEEERIKKYSAYLDEKAKEIDGVIAKQSQTLKDKYIPLSECVNIIMRKKTNLWEKSIDQKDFLSIRLGIGNRPIYADIKYSKESFSMEEDEMKEKIKEIVNSKKELVNVPVTVSLEEKNITSIIGSNDLLHEFFKGILLQLMTFHSYEFLKIVVLTNKENTSSFEYFRNIPYLFDDTKSIRFFATDLDETKELSLYLERIYQDRKANKRSISSSSPYYLVITDNYHMYRDIEIIKDILVSEENYGFSLMIFSDKLQNLPSECKNFINVNKERSGIFESEISIGNQREFQTEFVKDQDLFECIKKISNIPIEFNDEKGIPNTVSFLEMYNVGKVEQLNVLQRYQLNNSQKSLSVPIGIGKGATLLKLDLHEKYHGPHGLIAGMTGSGKSEFIITYILSMAINFSPLDVSFILIDYKGGGLAGAFENRETGVSLPHLSGTITNLDVAEMNRSLSSIQSELRRRQQLFNSARDKLGESTVDIYKYQKFYKEGKVNVPIPHLFIICDEFAELKTSQPDFMDQLIQTARIGRSLGVHLILATQKPSGVVNDQIWSNSRFRVCLKVQEKSDSNEMIKTPDAAFLNQVGRFYLQVGYNELFALGQSAWCGAKYYPTEKIKKEIDQSVLIIDDIGNVIAQNNDMKKVNIKANGEELGNILNYIIDCCKTNNLKADKLWLPQIVANIYVDNLSQKYDYHEEEYILNPVIGEYDDPNNQRQELLTINLTNDGNTCIYGSSGSGKELLFSSMIYSLVTNHSEEEINIYIMDYGSGTLVNFNGIPHVGDVVLSNDEEKAVNLFKMLDEEMERRKSLFVNYNGDYLTYVKRSDNKIPYILVFINYFDVFSELYDFDETINKLARESAKYGIIFITSVNGTNGMRYKLRQYFHSNITLQFNDQDDYSVIIGNTHKLFPSDIYGRGLVKLDNVYEFQTAHIANDDELLDKLDELKNKLKLECKSVAPKIPIVPKDVYTSDLINHLNDMKNVPIGINKDTIQTEMVNFKDNYINLVLSNDLDTSNDFVKALAYMFSKISNNNVVIIDAEKTFTDLNEEVMCVSDNYDNIIKKISDNMDYQYNEYVRNGYSNQTLINNRNMVIILYSFHKLMIKLNMENKKIFLELLEKCRDVNKFDFVIVDQADNMKKYEYDSWYKNAVNNNNGIWIGNGVADQTVIKTNIGFKKNNNEIPTGYGIVIKNGKTNLVNLIKSVNVKDEEVL